MAHRIAKVKRKTKETEIELTLDLDGTGTYKVHTPVPFLSHMLEGFSKHSGFDLIVKASGDTDVDDHHTVEDIGICLGEALGQALDHPEIGVGLAQQQDAGVGGEGDAAVPIEDADALGARLAAQLANDVVKRLAVVVQHFVARAAQDHVGDAVGGLLDEIVRVNALRPQVDEAEQGEEGRCARRHRDRELGGQSQPDCLAEAHLTATASASLSASFRGASSFGCASKIGKYSATTRKIAKPAPTMESVTATSVHLGM